VNRRAFLAFVSAVFARPLAAASQPAGGRRIGYLSDESSSVGVASFEPIAQGLRELGYVGDRSITFESRYADGQSGALPGLAAELVRRNVAVIVTVGTLATRAARSATGTIPIVFTRIADPVGLGLVASLARPGGNLTGVSVLTRDLAAKWLDLLAEAMPGLKRLGVMWDPAFPPAALQRREIERAARVLHLDLLPIEVPAAQPADAAVRALVERRAQALLVVPALLTESRRRLVALVSQHRLPTMWYRREFVDAGGLMSYDTNHAEMYRRAAAYVDKLLKGARPGDLPVEQPTTFELVINLKAARALGLTIPPSLLTRAEQVLE
jgi:putative ABC transport system substrate-binding protein